MILARIESTLTDTASRLGPILAPVPTAYLVGRATVEYLAWPTWVGFVAATVVECLGLATTATALTLWNYNQDKLKSDPHAPFRLALVLVGVYFVVATGLTVALDTVPDLARFAPAIFPSLSLTGVTVLAMRADHRRRLVEVEEAKAKRKRPKSSAVKAELVPAVTETRGTKQRAAAILAAQPGISGAALGEQLGYSERYGRLLKAELVPMIASDNGKEEQEAQ